MKNRMVLVMFVIFMLFVLYGCTPEQNIPIVCNDGEHLVDGNCEIIPIVCQTDQILENGVCISQLPVCNANEILENGVCVTLPPVCTETQILVDGVCVLLEINESEKTYTLQQVNRDFNQLTSSLDNNNPMLFSNEEEITLLIQEQRALLFDGMTQIELFRVLSPIVSAYRCGHTGISLSEALYQYNLEHSPIFPIFVQLFAQELYVVGNNESYDIPLGSKIISINGNSIESILDLILTSLSSDGQNISFKYALINMMFNELYFEYVNSDETFLVEYLEPDSTILLSQTIDGETSDVLYGDYINQNEDPFYAEYNDDYALLRIDTFQPFGNYTRTSFSAFFLEFFTTVETQEISNVIIDIRNNGGGDPMVSSDLFSYIAEYSQPYFAPESPNYYPGLKSNVPLKEPHFNGNLYVLINGMSFSTSGHFSALVKSQGIATFIGEESGGSYTCSDNSTQIRLSNTGMMLFTSRTIWTVAANDLEFGRGITPDYQVNPTIEDYLNDIDTVLEYTINLIQENK